MKITRFEDLECWQEARDLTKNVYALTKDGLFKQDYGLTDQIRRSAVSIMANIAEGFSRKTDREFIQFLLLLKDPHLNYKATCMWPQIRGMPLADPLNTCIPI